MQEAIKLLTLAGIDLDSPHAESLLRSGSVPESVILGVKKMAINLRDQEGIDAQDRRQDVTGGGDGKGGSREVVETVEVGALQQLESFDLDAYRNR